MIGHTTQAMKATAKPGTNLQDASHSADFVVTAIPASHASGIRFVVRDSKSGKMGSMDVPIKNGGHAN
jgi:predicted dinucleotide-binding enzyme